MAEPRSRPSASAEKPAAAAVETFPYGRWRDAGVLAEPTYVLAGAAALAGWDDDTEITRAELKAAVTAFLTHTPARED